MNYRFISIILLVLYFQISAQSQLYSYTIINTMSADSIINENINTIEDSTENVFKPERVLYEAAAGTLTGIGAFVISLVSVVAFEGADIHKDNSNLAPYIAFTAVNTGFALGVYLAASKYNSQTKFYNYFLVSMFSSTGAYFLAKGQNGAGWTALLPFGLTIIYSQIDYPSQVKINVQPQLMHGKHHSNFTLLIPLN